MPEGRRVALVLLTALVVALARPLAAPAAPSSSPIVGTWQVVEWWARDAKSGDRAYPFGRQPSGYYVYDGTGRVFVQVSRAPAAERLGEGRWRTLSQDELRKLVERHLAYFGTYAVDPGRSVLTEHVEADLAREVAGTTRDVPFRIDGDRLILGDQTTWQCVLMRAY
jgi:hypothetical protein